MDNNYQTASKRNQLRVIKIIQKIIQIRIYYYQPNLINIILLFLKDETKKKSSVRVWGKKFQPRMCVAACSAIVNTASGIQFESDESE